MKLHRIALYLCALTFFVPVTTFAVQTESLVQLVRKAPDGFFAKGIDGAAKMLVRGDANGALQSIDATLKETRRALYPERIFLLQSLCFLQLGQTKEALEAISRSIKESPSNSDALFIKSQLLQLEELNPEAERLLADAVWFGRFVLVSKPEALRTLAFTLRKVEKLGDAMAAAEQAANSGIRDEEFTALLGELYGATGKTEQAITTLRGGLRQYPSSTPMKILLGENLLRGTSRSLSTSQIDEAVQLAKETQNDQCCTKKARPLLVKALIEQGDLDGADQALSKIAAETPDYPGLPELRQQLQIERAAAANLQE